MEQELEGPAGQAFSALLTCSVDVVAGSMSCDPSDGLSGTAAGPQMNLIVGSQHRFVRMANDAPVVSGDVWSANVWVQNLTLQPFGTSDGETADAPSVQVFFVDEPNNGVEVLNHDDTDIFLDSTPAKYYTYFTILLGSDWILSPGEENTARPWEFQLNGATEFQFSVLVSTVVPDPDAIGVHLTRVSAGGSHACGDGADGKVYCWGDNSKGQLGDGTQTISSKPVAVDVSGLPAGVKLSGVSAGNGHTCALGSNGSVYCWGAGDVGQLGNGGGASLVPDSVRAPGNMTFTRVSAGGDHTCAEGTDGLLYCWGSNLSGKLGTGSGLSHVSVPDAVVAPPGVKLSRVAAGLGNNTCAEGTDGAGTRLYCWGANNAGQLGIGTQGGVSTLPPDSVQAGGAKLLAVTTGTDIACAEDSMGGIYCWGRNNVGQLGDGTDTNRSKPVAVDVSGLPAGVKLSGVTAGGNFACAVAPNGVYCWGVNATARLGDGTRTNRPTPVLVAGTRGP